MIPPFLLALLTFAVLIPVLAPLLRRVPAEEDGAARERAVYRDQLRELERDRERGLLTETEAASARLDIQRRLLAVRPDGRARGPDIAAASSASEIVSPDAASSASVTVTPGGVMVEPPVPSHAVPPVRRSGRSGFLAALTGIGVAGGALCLYFLLGAPLGPAEPGTPDATGAGTSIARLAAHLRAHPDDAEAWTLYARAMTGMRRWSDAEAAWRRVLALGRSSPDVVAALGETLVLRDNDAAGGAIGPEARALFEMALGGEPKHPMARYYMAQAAAADGDLAGAVSQWQALLADMPPDAAGRAEVARRIEEASRAAGLPVPAGEGERRAMIEGMVDKLAAHLRDTPGDAEGWTKLGRAYVVVGRAEAAADAYEKAAALKPGDPTLRRDAALALLAPLNPEDAIGPRALGLLRQAEASLPNDPAVLWYLGLSAARDRRMEEARGYWTRLATLLPPESEDGKMVRDALAALPPAPANPR